MKFKSICFSVVCLALLAATGASAESLTVFADSRFQQALQQLEPSFTDHTGFDVRYVFGDSNELADRLMGGEQAAVFFPFDSSAMDRVVEKGLIDITLKRNILVQWEGSEPMYLAAAVLINANHRVQALAFLDFLTSNDARRFFIQNGFTPP